MVQSVLQRIRPARAAAASRISVHRKTFSSMKKLPERSDCVVVGGGSVGCAVAYHLAAKGLSTVLIEAHSLTAGTTWHTAGMLWRLRPSYVDIELHEITRQRCFELEEALEEMEGEDQGSRRGTIFKANGGLFVATNMERLREYERLCEIGKHYYNVEAHMLSPEETLKVHPLLAVDDIVGSMYSPGDGTIDANNVCEAYKRVAKSKFGAIFSEKTRLHGILTREKSNGRRAVKGVQVVLDENDQEVQQIETDIVINAGGAWANSILDTCDTKMPRLPLLAMKHAYVVTEQIPALTELLGGGQRNELPNVRDHDLSIYIKSQGDALALGGYEQNPEFIQGLSPGAEFAFGLYDLDWDTFAQNLEGHFQRCPTIEETGIKSTVCGPESFTPDHKPLVGPSPDLDGLYLSCGFNSMGMMLAGGVAQELADWIIAGTSSRDMFSMDPRRFHANCTKDDLWVQQTTHESYAKTYAVVFPHDEPLAGREQRKSAVHEDLVNAGCVLHARHGFERPGWFSCFGQEARPLPYDFYGAYSEADSAWRLGSQYENQVPKHDSNKYEELITGDLSFDFGESFAAVAKECYECRTNAVVFDQSYFGKFLIQGPTAEAFVNYVCAAGAPKKIHRTTYTPLCNVNGGVEADLTVTRLGDDSFYFVAGGSTCSRDWQWLRDVASDRMFTAGLSMRDLSDEYSVLSVQGPMSRRIVSSLMPPDDDRLGGPDFDAFKAQNKKIMPFSSALVNVTIADVPDVTVLRLTFVGELGFELHVPASAASRVLNALRAAGATDAGYRAMDSLSAEKGYRHWHADLSNAETPFEANIGFTVNRRLKTPGEAFIGASALYAAHKQPYARKRLVCLSVGHDEEHSYHTLPPSQNPVPLHGTETIWRGDTCMGFVRSTAFSHANRATIAYGYLHSRHPFSEEPLLDGSLADDTWLNSGEWSIGDKGKRHPAKLHLGAAPYDPENLKVKSVLF